MELELCLLPPSFTIADVNRERRREQRYETGEKGEREIDRRTNQAERERGSYRGLQAESRCQPHEADLSGSNGMRRSQRCLSEFDSYA